MAVKASAEYYNLEKVAEVLSVPASEVNRLREQGKLRGLRDGNTWKFFKEEVHTYLAGAIKARSGSANDGHKPGESDFDLGGTSASSSFDVLMEDAALPDDSDLISVVPARPASDLDLAALDQDDELSLAEETQISSLVVPKKPKPKEEPVSVVFEDDEDSSALILAAVDESSALEDEASVLEAGGSSPQLGLAGDSGFDVLVAGEDEDILLVENEKTSMPEPAAQKFELEPSPNRQDNDDSESSSQVIAIDAFAGIGQEAADPFGQQEGGFGAFTGFDSDIHQPPSQTTAPGDPFGMVTPDAFTPPIASVSPQKVTAPIDEYSTGTLVTLVIALVVMLLPGLMLIDTMVHMWSWGEPFILNSILMDTISGLFGL